MLAAMGDRFEFAGMTFDAERGELTRRGQLRPLRPRTAEVLRCLLESPRALVTREQLLDRVWNGLVVTDNSLAQCVSEIRRELGDGDEAIVRTVARKGYRLEADVATIQAETNATPRHPGISLIVLPLAVGDADQEWFADALTEDLTTDLGRIPRAFVISRGTAATFRGKALDVRAIGRELGVRYVVEGSVRRRGEEVTVNLALSDATTAAQIWAERFEAPRGELPALQHSMAGSVAQSLYTEIYGAEARRVERIRDPDAHELAMRAWYLWYRISTKESSDEARRLASVAVERDPRCVLGWHAIASTLILDLALRWTKDPAASLDAAEAALRRAREIDPEAVTGTWGIVLVYRERFEEGLAALEKQIEMNPNLPLHHQWKGITHILMGDPHLAHAPLENAIRIGPRDPRMSTYMRNIALAHLHEARIDRAVAMAERSVRLPNPWARSFETLAAAYGCAGMIAEARDAVGELLARWPGYSIAQHRAEQISHRAKFVAQRERVLDGLRKAGLPESQASPRRGS